MRLMIRVIREQEYYIAKYARAKLIGGNSKETPGFGAKPSWKFLSRATSSDDLLDFRANAVVAVLRTQVTDFTPFSLSLSAHPVGG